MAARSAFSILVNGFRGGADQAMERVDGFAAALVAANRPDARLARRAAVRAQHQMRVVARQRSARGARRVDAAGAPVVGGQRGRTLPS